MAQIRQELNLLAGEVVTTTTGSSRVQIDTTQYNGTVTYYAEVLAKVTSGSGSAIFDDDASSTVVTVSSITATSYTLYRTSFTPSAGQTTLHVTGTGTGISIKSARIIIIQNATTLTNTETQIEIGNNATTTSTTNVAVTNPKYWFYEDGNWDGTKTVYFEATIACASTKSATFAELQVSDSSSIAAPTWSDVASAEVTTTSTTGARVRTGAITLTADRWYRVVFRSGTSKSAATIYNAKVIIDQADGANLNSDSDAAIQGGTAGAGQAAQAAGQKFKIQTTSSITGVKLKLKKTASPTDTLVVDIVSSLGGSSLAQATLSASTLTTSYVLTTLTFGTPVSLTGGSTYYIQVTRSPDTRDATNFVSVQYGSLSTYTDGEYYARDNNSWASPTTGDFYFELIGNTGLTKLEPQYLLANTLFAAGTSLQTFLTKWDSTEWDDGAGSITYYFQSEAANGSTSDVTLEEADGGGTVTNSTLTNIDNAQISSALTMPADQNLDTKATTNAGDVAAARILVAYVFAAAAVVEPVPYTNPNLKALLIMGVGV